MPSPDHRQHSTPSPLVIRQPDDWHVHLRDGAMLKDVVLYTARQFGRAIVMPNLNPPVTNRSDAIQYRNRIRAALAPDANFTPLMTCYLTDNLDLTEIARGFDEGVFSAAKLYPAHATTNSGFGVTDMRKIRPVLETMQRIGMPLLVHGEVTDKDVDIFDREAVFIERIMLPLLSNFPALKVVFEHITTKDAADFVASGDARLAATITPHHLEINRNAMFEKGIRPHFYCLPVAKREAHRQALRGAAMSGSPKFFLGTDSAPHPVAAKESACGCAGIFNTPFAIESYAKSFAEEGALDRLEGFAAQFGAEFYGLPLNDRYIRLDAVATEVPAKIPAAGDFIVPFLAEQTIPWKFSGFAEKPVRESQES